MNTLEILQIIADEKEIELDDLLKRKCQGSDYAEAMYLMTQYTNLCDREIGVLFGCHSAAVSYCINAVKERKKRFKTYREAIYELGKKINDKVDLSPKKRLKDVPKWIVLRSAA